MADEIARGVIEVDLNQRDAIEELRRLDKEFDRTMRDIDRKEAEVRITGNLRDFKRTLEQAEKLEEQRLGRIEKLEERRRKTRDRDEKVSLTRKIEGERKALAALKAQVESAEERSEAAEEYLNHLKAINQEVDRGAKRQKAIAAAEKRQREAAAAAAKQRAREEASLDAERRRNIENYQRIQARAAEQAARTREQTAAREERVERDLHRERLRNIENFARAQERARKAAATLEEHRARELEDVPKLQRAYAELGERIDALNDKRRAAARIRDERQVAVLDFRIADAETNFRRIEAELERRGAAITIPFHLEPGRDLGERVRAVGRDRSVIGAAVLGGGVIGAAMTRGLIGAFSPGNIRAGAVRGMSRIGSILSGLSQMTVRVGPFTATIRQLAVVTALLGPMLVDLAGSLGALVGVLGSATVGFGALTAGLLGGMIPAAIGVFSVLKPLTEEFGNAMKASDAYAKAVREHGEGSDQAAKKGKVLRRVLRGVDEETLAAFKSAGGLSQRWAKLTEPSRVSAFNVIGAALGFADRNMDSFGKRTNETFRVAEGGLTRWIRGLDSVEGRNILGNMMDNFNEALGPALDGLGNLIAHISRFASAASDALPGFARQFERWTEGLLEGSDSASTVREKVDRMLDSLRSVGRFLLAGGRLMSAFFGGGVESGQRFLDTMTNAMNRWTAFLRTTEGQESLAGFFERSVSGVQALYAALEPVVTTFVEWASTLSPFAAAFFRGAAAVGNLVAGVLDLVALRGPVSALVATLGALWAVGKISAATAAVVGFTRAMLGLKTATQGAAAANAALSATSGAGIIGSFLRGPGGGAAGGLAAAMAASGGWRAALLRLAPALGAVASVAGIAGAAAVIFGGRARTAADDVRDLVEASDQAGRDITSSADALEGAYSGVAPALSDAQSATKEVASAQRAVAKLMREGKTNTAEYRAEIDRLNAALSRRAESERASLQHTGNIITANQRLAAANQRVQKLQAELPFAYRDSRNEAQRWVDLADDGNQRLIRSFGGLERVPDKLLATMKPLAGRGEEFAAATRAMAEAMRELNDAQGDQARAANIANLAQINMSRALKGLQPIATTAAAAVKRVTDVLGQTRTAKIAIQFPDPREAARVMQAIDRAIRGGISGKRAFNIVANSKDAEQAIRRLNAIRLTPKRVEIIEQGGDDAVRMLERIAGRKLDPKEQRIAERGGPGVLALLERIIGRRLTPKEQFLTEQGGQKVLGKIGEIINKTIGNKIVNIIARDRASSIINAMSGVRTIGQRIVELVTRRRGRADGGVVAPAEKRMPFVEDRALQRASASGPRQTRGGRYARPTLLVGEEDKPEFVISTNPRYRDRNVGFLRLAAQALGVETARRGRKPSRKPRLIKGAGGDAEKIREVQAYKALQQREEDQQRKISIADRQVQEPESFLRQTGTDPATGEETYAIDQGKIDTYKTQLSAVRTLWDEMIDPGGIVEQMVTAASAAYRALKSYTERRRDNIHALVSTREMNKRLLRSRNEETRERARDRYDRANDLIRDQQGKIEDAGQVRADIEADQHDLTFRRQEYGIERADVNATIAAVDAQAAEELGRATPPAPPPVDAGTPAERDIGRLEAERAMAQAGLGGRDEAAIISDLIAANRARIGEAEEMLRDADAGNDLAAYGIIQSAAGAIRSLTDELTSLPGSAAMAAQQMATLSTARGELFRRFGSNFAPAASFGRAGSFMAPRVGAGAYGFNPAAGPVGGGTTVTVNNTFPTPPPDPHTWSRGVAWELQAAV